MERRRGEREERREEEPERQGRKDNQIQLRSEETIKGEATCSRGAVNAHARQISVEKERRKIEAR